MGHVALIFIARPRRRRRPRPLDASPTIPPRVRRHQSFSVRPDPVSAPPPPSLRSWFCGSTQVTRRFCGEPQQTPRATPIMNRYPAPAPVHDFVLLFLPPCGPHLTPLATGSLNPSLLVSPILGGPARHRPFAPNLHRYQRKSSCNLHLQYSTKSQSTPHC
jgi:hypothetical protein